MLNLTPIDIAKFWMQVEVDKDSTPLRTADEWFGRCWIWKGSLLQSGYGRYFLHQKAYRSHRVSFYIHNGKLANNLFICHKCDNPACVNPLHLFEGTAADNTKDMIKRGRLVRERGKWPNKSSNYYGVTHRKECNVWRIRCMIEYKNYLTEVFKSEIEAAQAYDVGVIRLYNSGILKHQKPLNFPEVNYY